MKSDSVGDSLWTKNYSFQPFSAKATSILKFENYLFICGSLTDTLNFKTFAFVIKTNDLGKVLSTAIVKDSVNLRIIDCKVLNNLIKIFTQNSSIFENRSSIINLDFNLNELSRNAINLQAATVFDQDILYGVSNGLNFSKFLNTKRLWSKSSLEEDAYPVKLIQDGHSNLICIGNIKSDQSTKSRGFIIKIKDSNATKQINNQN